MVQLYSSFNLGAGRGVCSTSRLSHFTHGTGNHYTFYRSLGGLVKRKGSGVGKNVLGSHAQQNTYVLKYYQKSWLENF